MRTLNNLDNILTSLVNNQFNLRPIFLIKIDSLEVYYDIKYEGMYVLKLKTNSNFLKENQYILDYFVNYADIDYYIKNNYLNNIMFVEKEIINEIDNIKKYITRLAIFAVISHFAFSYYEEGSLNNIFATLNSIYSLFIFKLWKK